MNAGVHLGRAARRLLVVLAWAAASANGASACMASAFDSQTTDPHALTLLYHSRVAFQACDTLLNRDQQYRLEPALALSWQALNATTWRIRMRAGVTFHDGSSFSADDAVFSIERALAAPSQRGFQRSGVTGARKVDDVTIDIVLEAPTPDAWVSLNGMFRGWEKSGGGTFNAGRHSNPQLDALVQAMRNEPDLTRRRAMVAAVLRMANDDLPLVHLFRRTISWAMSKKVEAIQWPNETIELRPVRLQ